MEVLVKWTQYINNKHYSDNISILPRLQKLTLKQKLSLNSNFATYVELEVIINA